jgi:capsular exopolysaccharide synthesis family protein
VRLFNLKSNKQGITTYISSDEPGYELLEQQIFHGVCNPNLDVLPAGVIPPNPSELISREQLDRAIQHLRDHYDYVLLDTPPVGLVSDTLSIARTADITLFVCRADYTPRNSFELINNLKNEEKLPNLGLVLNGMDLKKKKYGYYYGYGKYGRYSKYGKYGLYGHYGKADDKQGHAEN